MQNDLSDIFYAALARDEVEQATKHLNQEEMKQLFEDSCEFIALDVLGSEMLEVLQTIERG